MNPADADAHFNLATLLARKKAATAALKEVRKCLSLRPNYKGAKTLLGSLLYMTGNLTRAIFYLRQGLVDNPESPVAHDYLAVALLHEGQTQEAIDQWELVARLDPSYAIVHYNLARAFEKLGQHQKSEAEMKEFLKMQEAVKRRREAYRKSHPF